MAGSADVDPETLRSTADWLDKSATELADKVDSHMRAVRAFIGPEWSGTAARSHEEPWSEWEEGARRTIGSFTTDAGALRAAAAGFAATDKGTARDLTRTTSSLDLP